MLITMFQKTDKNGNHLSPVERAVPRTQTVVVMMTAVRLLNLQSLLDSLYVKILCFGFWLLLSFIKTDF